MAHPTKNNLPSTASDGGKETKKRKVDLIPWNNDRSGSDKLTSDQRIVCFLLLEDGKYLNTITPTTKQKKRKEKTRQAITEKGR